MPVLPLARYRFEFVSSDKPRLPPYTGSAWRGAFGHALKHTVCVTREPACPSCLLYRSCPYPYLFETPPPPEAEKMRRYTAAPHPFVLAPADIEQVGSAQASCIPVYVTLFGRAQGYLPYVLHALARAGERGIGGNRTPLELTAVKQEDPVGSECWQQIYESRGTVKPLPSRIIDMPAAPYRLTLELQTPLRLKREGRNVTPEHFRFHDLFGNLLRRISMLSYFHTDDPLETDFKRLVQHAHDVQWQENDLQWRELTRYSARQRTKLKMGGLVGHVRLNLHTPSPFWPYLWLGQWTHAGKGTTMGLGRYALKETAILPNNNGKVAP